jgi:hypothetical protein
MIDLDNLNPSENRKTENIGTAGPLAGSKGATLESIYDRYTRLLYLIDVSGSMANSLLDLSDVDHFRWDEKVWETIGKRIENAKTRAAVDMEEMAAFLGTDEEAEDEDEDEDDEEEEEEDWLRDPSATHKGISIHKLSHEDLLNDIFWLGIEGLSKPEQKLQIISGSAWTEVDLMPVNGRKLAQVSKMEAVKQNGRKMIEERYAKFPDADVHLLFFEGSVSYRKPSCKEDLLNQLKGVRPDGGSTDISGAMRRAIEMCKKNPSPVNSHHIVLVTDGLDSEAAQVKFMIPEMKELSIVLDFIHVSSPQESGWGENASAVLKEVCQELGGSYSLVKRISDFENRFLAASRRLCLPAPAGH